MGWIPVVESVCGAEVACPEAFRVPVPSDVTPSMNVTVSPATPATLAVGEVNVAVKVTACAVVEGLILEFVIAMAVDAGFTVCGSGAETLGAKLLSPE